VQTVKFARQRAAQRPKFAFTRGRDDRTVNVYGSNRVGGVGAAFLTSEGSK
jgi:hypothetical protein